MTIKYLDSKRIVGLSTGSVADSNLIFSQSVTPASFTGNNIFALTFSADGTVFYEKDTNKEYILYNGAWSEL